MFRRASCMVYIMELKNVKTAAFSNIGTIFAFYGGLYD